MDNRLLAPPRNAAGYPLIVRDPHSHTSLAEDGEWKPLTPFWLRRLRDGDVLDVTPASEPVDPPAASERTRRTRS